MDIDAVYTWVNSADPNWKELYKSEISRAGGTEFFHPSVNNPARFQSRCELSYSIKSIRKYASWIRNIFVVTNCALPSELAHCAGIIRIDHQKIFPDPSVLPTFNSRAIESNLHRISGLSERFIYFNDDVFLCRPVFPGDFYGEDGRAFVFPSKHEIPYGVVSGLRPVDYGILNACELLMRDFEYRPEKKLHHAPFPLTKSMLSEIEEKYSGLLEKTRQNRFRDRADLPLATTLHAYYALATGRAMIKEVAARYVDIGDPLFVFLVHRLSPLRRGKYLFLCLNEVTAIKRFSRIRDRILDRLMREMFDE